LDQVEQWANRRGRIEKISFSGTRCDAHSLLASLGFSSIEFPLQAEFFQRIANSIPRREFFAIRDFKRLRPGLLLLY